MERSHVARAQFATWAPYQPDSESVEKDDGLDEASDGEWEEGETEIIMVNGQLINYIH